MTLFLCFCYRIIVRDTLTEAEGVGNVVTLVRDDDVDVIFGNPSSDSKYFVVLFVVILKRLSDRLIRLITDCIKAENINLY